MKKNLKILVASCLLVGSLSVTVWADSTAVTGNPGQLQAVPVQNERVIPITDPVNGEIGGAMLYEAEMPTKNHVYRPVLDFYNGGFSDTVQLIKHFKTYQQTSGISCGAATSIMLLNHYGMQAGENALVKEMDIRGPENKREDGSYGASTASLVKVLKDRGFKVQSSIDTANKDGISFPDIMDFKAFVQKQLADGNPVAVESVEWGGHWQIIIGYDDFGTPSPIDDMLIMADPYDTSDQNQDGYVTKNAYRYYAAWVDYNVLGPNEKVQQYVTVVGRP